MLSVRISSLMEVEATMVAMKQTEETLEAIH
jgi:hypothetical protein